MSRHAQAMDAAGFWRQFVTAYYFDAPGDTIAGTLVDYSADGPPKDPTPRLILQTKEGDRYTVTATQERLKAALKAECPAIGDRIKITYTGEADKAAPGMSKAKLFVVEVRRPGSQPPGRSPAGETLGGVPGGENASGAGK